MIWTYRISGYQWIQACVAGDSVEEPIIIPSCDISDPFDIQYDPVGIPEIFREFAGIDGSREAVSAFANKRGLLGIEQDIVGRMEDGETLRDWLACVGVMRFVLSVWDAIEGENPPALDRLIKWDEKAIVWRYEIDGEMFHVPPTDGFIAAAGRLIIARWVNSLIAQHCSPQIVHRDGVSSLRIEPKNLLGVIWWQFARVLMGELTYRKCKGCGQTIEISDRFEGRRSTREFCDELCKAREFIEKKKRVCELRAAGKTLKELADEFGVDQKQIKKWVKE